MIPFSNLAQLSDAIGVKALGLNWVDILILLVFAVYIFEGYTLGFLRAFFDFLGFVLSFTLGLLLYSFWGNILTKTFSIPRGFAEALGFFIMAFLSEIVLGFFFRLIFKFQSVKSLDEKLSQNKKFNQILGVIPSFLSSLVLVTFILVLIASLPLSPFIKNSVYESRLGNTLISNSQGLKGEMNKVFGGAVKDALTFLTVEPQSNNLISLNFKTQNIKVDPNAEKEMFAIVNQEREKKGLKALSFDILLRDVGRKHCSDMFKRGYFSHYTPEGLSPFDRIGQDGISYAYAGENLAFAPNVNFAMQGLMQSPGHRANILSANFGRVGIGVIDGGIYGEMFCQEFTD